MTVGSKELRLSGVNLDPLRTARMDATQALEHLQEASCSSMLQPPFKLGAQAVFLGVCERIPKRFPPVVQSKPCPRNQVGAQVEFAEES